MSDSLIPSPAKPPAQAWWRQRAVWLVLLVVVALLAWLLLRPAPGAEDGGGRRGKRGADQNRPLPVQVAPVRQGDVNVYLSGLGTVTAANSVTVKSRVDGQLMKLHFEEGQLVRAGDLLAEIDPRAFQAQLAQMEGQAAKDEALLNNAKLDLQRYQTLLTQDSTSKQQVDTQRSLVRQYQGALKADQGQIAAARLNLAYSRITAPVSGRLGLRQVDPGNIVHASDSNGIVSITQVQPIHVLFTLPEAEIGKVIKPLHAGVKLPVDAYDREQKAKLASGVLITADNQIDAATGTVKLKARFANDDDSLFPNQFVNVRLLVDTVKNALLIPSAAVQRGTPGTFVYVVNTDKTVNLRPITLGPADGDSVAVVSGLKPGETVVTDGADKLKEGGQVLLPGPARGGAASGPAAGQRHGGKGEWKRKHQTE
jgi:multidrug efflux system membrane fusion protein